MAADSITIGSTIDDETKRELVDNDNLLPAGSAFIPGETSIPDYQLAWGITSDDDGNPIHGEPAADAAERELVIPVEEPDSNEALLYMLTSEVNYNDIWAVTGVPVSTFPGHDRDWHITGSGGLALVAEVGAGVEDEGRIEVGDLVHVYAGKFDALSPKAGRDPMYADFRIQGYETPDGSHQQFMTAQATQLFEPPSTLNLTEAGSYILTMGTIYRALTNTLDVKPGTDVFVEGASTGTGRDAVGMAASRGLDVTGLVSSDERAERAKRVGADAAIDRTQDALAGAMRMVPNDPDAWDDWVAAGQPLLDEFRAKNDGKLADYAISHAGQEAFSRTYQLLDEGGRVTFYGASTGYEMAFVGKGGTATPGEMYDRSGLRPGQGVLVWYGTPDAIDGTSDTVGETAIETALDRRARVAVVTETAEQADVIESTYDVEGAVSLETLAAENEEVAFEPLPELPKPSKPDKLAATVGEYSNKLFKPIGIAMGEFLATPNNPRGNPDVVFERAGQNTLGTSTMLCAPFMGKVVYAESMADRRYSFYAPQVWMRQRRIYMPTTEIFGTHMKNTYEVLKMNEEIERDIFDVPPSHLVDWDDAPKAHQDIWENNHEEGSYVINHALPDDGIESKDELFERWDV